VDEAPIPQRLAHLQWIAVSSGDIVAGYLKVRASLATPSRVRQSQSMELRSLSVPPEELKGMIKGVKKLTGGLSETGATRLFPDASRVMELVMPGRYLILGQNSDGSRYYGRAEIVWKAGVFVLTSTIGDDVFHYEGKPVNQALVCDGSHHVVYRRNAHNGCLYGEWDEGGLETLIPALNSGPKS
jgi:hypothetical protein